MPEAILKKAILKVDAETHKLYRNWCREHGRIMESATKKALLAYISKQEETAVIDKQTTT